MLHSVVWWHEVNLSPEDLNGFLSDIARQVLNFRQAINSLPFFPIHIIYNVISCNWYRMEMKESEWLT